MICKRCKSATAIISLPSHNTGFCENCFRDFFSAQVARGIETGKLFTHEDRILVALSGGKDSLSLMLELSRQGYDVTGLHIDLGIPGSSEIVRGVIERFCGKHGFKLIVKEMAKEGLAIPLVKQRLKRPICSACGKIKRHYFNKTALEEGFTALATGHNLDDEIARLFSNTLRWDVGYLSDQGPRLDGEDGFARKVKPFWRLTEFETSKRSSTIIRPALTARARASRTTRGSGTSLKRKCPDASFPSTWTFSSAGVPPSPGSKGRKATPSPPAPSAATRHPPGCAASAASGKSSRKEKSRVWEGERPFLEKGPLPLPNPPLSTKAFGLIESLFPVFRKVKAGGADRVRKNILRANQF